MAIGTTFDDIICVAPQFTDQQTRVEKVIVKAEKCISESVWGDKAVDAAALLTAHMLTVFDMLGIGGEIKRKKLGDEEIEFGINTSDDAHELKTTGYGKLYLALRRTLVLSPLVAGC